MYPSKVVKKPPFRQVTRNSQTIFQFGPREMEISHLQQIVQIPAQFANLLSKSRKIIAIHNISREINKIHTNFNCSSICFLDTHKTGSATLPMRITRISQP